MNKLYSGDIIQVTNSFTLNGKLVKTGRYRVLNPVGLELFWRDHFVRTGVSLLGKDFDTFPIELIENS